MSRNRPLSGLVFLIVLIGAFAVSIWVLRSGAEERIAAEPDPTSPPLVVRVVEARRLAGYEVEREFVGRIEARRTSRIGFEVAGKLARVRFDDGDLVEAGQLLAELDVERLHARRKEFAAALREAEARRDLAERTFARNRIAIEGNAISRQELDETRQTLAAQEAGVDRLEAAIDSVDVDIRKSRLHAPFEGRIAVRLVDEGTVLDVGDPVFDLIERTSPRARIGLSVPASRRVGVGSVQRLRIDGQELQGRVLALLPRLERASRTIEALIEIDAELGAIRDGEMARLHLRMTTDTPGYWLPLSALSENSRGLWSCFVVVEDADSETGRAVELRELELVHARTDRVYVRGSLAQGEMVVFEGAHRLVQGLPVRLETAREMER